MFYHLAAGYLSKWSPRKNLYVFSHIREAMILAVPLFLVFIFCPAIESSETFDFDTDCDSQICLKCGNNKIYGYVSECTYRKSRFLV
mgnify:CR=1 FL=1